MVLKVFNQLQTTLTFSNELKLKTTSNLYKNHFQPGKH